MALDNLLASTELRCYPPHANIWDCPHLCGIDQMLFAEMHSLHPAACDAEFLAIDAVGAAMPLLPSEKVADVTNPVPDLVGNEKTPVSPLYSELEQTHGETTCEASTVETTQISDEDYSRDYGDSEQRAISKNAARETGPPTSEARGALNDRSSPNAPSSATRTKPAPDTSCSSGLMQVTEKVVEEHDRRLTAVEPTPHSPSPAQAEHGEAHTARETPRLPPTSRVASEAPARKGGKRHEVKTILWAFYEEDDLPGVPSYLVEWVEGDATVVPAENMDHCDLLLAKYHHEHPEEVGLDWIARRLSIEPTKDALGQWIEKKKPRKRKAKMAGNTVKKRRT